MDRIPLIHRMRRNRRTEAIRRLVRETELHPHDLVWPLFVVDRSDEQIPVDSMPGCFRWSRDRIVEQAKEAHAMGISAVLAVITDVAMDPYSSDGHDGIVRNGEIVNDETLEILAAMALAQARAGADIVAPSDMMDGRVGYLRDALDADGFANVGILAYSAKYASAYYGPFRDALDSAPKDGDKKTYQMDPANAREALREVELDIDEGADMVMVKPAMPYLDVIADIRANCDVPIAAYQVSGEYAMLKAAGERGWLDADACLHEALVAIRRAGADMILSYAAKDVAATL